MTNYFQKVYNGNVFLSYVEFLNLLGKLMKILFNVLAELFDNLKITFHIKMIPVK